MDASRSKKPGSCTRTCSAQRRLFSSRSRRSAMTSLPDVARPAARRRHGHPVHHVIQIDLTEPCVAFPPRAGRVGQAFAATAGFGFAFRFARVAFARVFRSVTLRGRARLTAFFLAEPAT